MAAGLAMWGTLLQRVVRDDRFIVVCGLLAAIAFCWIYLLSGAGIHQQMGGMLMPMSIWPWTLSHAALMLLMWIVMMAAMMLPSAMPTILLYRTIVNREINKSGNSPLRTVLFVTGYLAIWLSFSVAAVVLQFLLEWAELLSPMMEATSERLSGLIIMAAGIYQISPLKAACIDHCRSPLEFVLNHWRKGNVGAFAMGMHHGIYCLGCCWSMMLLLFVGGLMNYLWIAGIALFILVEKLAPGGHRLSRLAALPLIFWGLLLIVPAWRTVVSV